MLRFQGLRVFKRTLVETGIKKPQSVKVINQASEAESPVFAATLSNGTRGTKLFPKGTIATTVKKELNNVVGWALSFSVMMLIWPYMSVKTNNMLHNVPPQTPLVVIDGGKPRVNSPIRPAHLSQGGDDE